MRTLAKDAARLSVASITVERSMSTFSPSSTCWSSRGCFEPALVGWILELSPPARKAAAMLFGGADPPTAAPDDGAAPLPEGWQRVTSRSRPGEYSYLNTRTGERFFGDRPTVPAPRICVCVS